MSEYTKMQTARTIICELCNDLYPDDPCEPADCDWLRMLEEDAVPVPQWISVKDGMPENEKQVILLRRNGKVSRAEVRKIGETVRFRLYSEEDDYSPVTNWAAFPAMPLPEPPKEDADNG